jgi:hypothetical protein
VRESKIQLRDKNSPSHRRLRPTANVTRLQKRENVRKKKKKISVLASSFSFLLLFFFCSRLFSAWANGKKLWLRRSLSADMNANLCSSVFVFERLTVQACVCECVKVFVWGSIVDHHVLDTS